MIREEKLRLKNKWSKREVSRRSGIDAALISLAENRGLRLYPGQLKSLAPVFGIPDEEAETLLDEVEA